MRMFRMLRILNSERSVWVVSNPAPAWEMPPHVGDRFVGYYAQDSGPGSSERTNLAPTVRTASRYHETSNPCCDKSFSLVEVSDQTCVVCDDSPSVEACFAEPLFVRGRGSESLLIMPCNIKVPAGGARWAAWSRRCGRRKMSSREFHSLERERGAQMLFGYMEVVF